MFPTLFTIPGLNLPVSGYPVMVLIGFVVALITARRRARRVGADYDLMPTAFLIMAVAGLIGARLFYVIHYWEKEFAGADDPIGEALNFGTGGAELYGGIILSIIAMLVYLRARGKSIALYFDIIVPSIVLAQFFGRLACFLYGCCWGGVCVHADGQAAVPWAVQFPYGSLPYLEHWEHGLVEVPDDLMYTHEGRRMPIPAEVLALSAPQHRVLHERLIDGADRTDAGDGQSRAAREQRDRMQQLASVLRGIARPGDTPEQAYARLTDLRARAGRLRSLPVHPTQLYFAINALLLAVLLAEIFKRRIRDGSVFGWMLLLYPPSRVIQEVIRSDNPRDVFGMTVSTAISLGLMSIAAVYLLWLRRRPARYLRRETGRTTPRAVHATA